MQTAIVENGLFEVNELGEVWRISRDKKVLAPQIKTGRNRKYRVVTAQINGKQKHFYVHRLVATAFIPNPKNLPEINHIDGNPANNRVENLEWCSRSYNAAHAFRTGLVNPYRNAKPCICCGELTNAKDQVCLACKPILLSEAHAEDKLATLRDQMSAIDQSVLTEIEQRYVNLRKEGYTLMQIGQICGVSRQCVDQAIKHSMVKTATGVKMNAQIRKEILRLQTKAKKKRANIEKLELEQKFLIEEVTKLEQAINMLVADNQPKAG